jgi:L-ascorbate metabolism protein UlaG (beta-lactamase superfamily)
MRVTWHGHSFFELEADGTTVLIDPFLDGNPATDAEPGGLDADVVAVTHGHHDHAGDADRFDAPVVCQPELAGYYGEKGVEATGMNVGGTYEDGVEFTMTKAFHSSGAPEDGDFDRYGGTPAGFVVDDGETRFYHAGDTSLFGDMKTVVRDVYAPDAAAVPIGDRFTMGPHDAATAVDWLGVDEAFPMHYDTFPPIEQDPVEFADTVDGARVHVPEPGETVVL